VLSRVVEIHMHLAGVGVCEFAQLQIDDDEQRKRRWKKPRSTRNQ
jgi:hypothetical protein